MSLNKWGEFRPWIRDRLSLSDGWLVDLLTDAIHHSIWRLLSLGYAGERKGLWRHFSICETHLIRLRTSAIPLSMPIPNAFFFFFLFFLVLSLLSHVRHLQALARPLPSSFELFFFGFRYDGNTDRFASQPFVEGLTNNILVFETL